MSKPLAGNAETQLGITESGRNWYARGYLPHRYRIGLLQSIRFRQTAGLPLEKLKQLEVEMECVRKNAELGLVVPGIGAMSAHP